MAPVIARRHGARQNRRSRKKGRLRETSRRPKIHPAGQTSETSAPGQQVAVGRSPAGVLPFFHRCVRENGHLVAAPLVLKGCGFRFNITQITTTTATYLRV